jgi:uncharacterized protein (DUF58 family)
LGKLFLMLMLLFYAASVTSQSGLLLLLIGLIGGCFIVNGSFARRNVRNVLVHPPKEAWLVEGAKSDQPWRLQNSSSKHFEQIELFNGETLICAAPLVKVGESVSIVPDTVYPRRGVFPNSAVMVRSSAPYGLLRAERRLEIEGEVTVYPRIYEAESPIENAMGLEALSGGKFRGGRRVNSGTHFAGVRVWQAGDSIKQVDWKTTARREQLMVKSFEEELGGRLTIILDAAAASEEIVDNAVRAAGSVAAAVLQDGHHLDFVDFSGEPVLRLPPFSDEQEVLERLARYNPGSAKTAPDLETIARRSTVALIGTEWRESWTGFVAEAARQNRQVHVYLPVKTAIPAEVAEALAGIWEFEAREIRGV